VANGQCVGGSPPQQVQGQRRGTRHGRGALHGTENGARHPERWRYALSARRARLHQRRHPRSCTRAARASRP
jgi:hypothetical protein